MTNDRAPAEGKRQRPGRRGRKWRREAGAFGAGCGSPSTATSQSRSGNSRWASPEQDGAGEDSFETAATRKLEERRPRTGRSSPLCDPCARRGAAGEGSAAVLEGARGARSGHLHKRHRAKGPGDDAFDPPATTGRQGDVSGETREPSAGASRAGRQGRRMASRTLAAPGVGRVTERRRQCARAPAAREARGSGWSGQLRRGRPGGRRRQMRFAGRGGRESERLWEGTTRAPERPRIADTIRAGNKLLNLIFPSSPYP